MKRLLLGICVLSALILAATAIQLVREQQRQLSYFSVPTTATVLKKRLDIHRHPHRDRDGPSVTYEPVVQYRYQARGREFTSEAIFPREFRIGGNLGRVAAQAALDGFEVGQEVTAYYNPDLPADACLIRRPPLLPYGFVLLPVMLVSGVVGFASQSGGAERKRWKGRWIAAVWYGIGLISAGHYFYLAGADYHGSALVLFGLYAQFGLVPVAIALPSHGTSESVSRVRHAITGSFFGTFLGFWLGLLIGWIAYLFSASATFRLGCWGYTLAAMAALFALLCWAGETPDQRGEVSPSAAAG